MRDDTTIAVMKSTRQKLEDLKIHDRETFDDLLNRIVNEINKLKKQRGKNKRLV